MKRWHLDIWILALIALIIYVVSESSHGSGYFPEPVYTNDPEGNLDPETMYETACRATDFHIDKGLELYGHTQLTIVTDYANGKYVYYFFLQDLLDICLVMRSV